MAHLLVNNAVIVFEEALHAVDLVAHLLPLRLGLLVVEVLLYQGVVLSIACAKRQTVSRFEHCSV